MLKRLAVGGLLILFIVACNLSVRTPMPSLVVTPSIQGRYTPTTVRLVPAVPVVSAVPAVAQSTPTPVPTPVVSGRPNVILIVVDSLRADHVSSYGYARPTTRNLDALVAAEGIRFEDAVSPAPWTCPANASLMSGRTPSSLGASWLDLNNTLPGNAYVLAEALHDAGYYTAGFVNNNCVDSRRGFGQGFDFFDDSLAHREGSDSSNKARAYEVNALATGWLQANWLAQPAGGRPPLFLYLYYMEPHVWYQPPAPYDTLYDNTYAGTLTGAAYGIGRDVVLGNITPSARDVEHLQALYDGEISYWDAHLGQMLAYLQAQGLMENTLIVVTGDHGEAFGEHGKWVHGSALYEEEIRVPLVMRYSGAILPGQVVTRPVQSMDLMPTILDYAGAAVPAEVQAVSLRPLASGMNDMPVRAVFSELNGLTDEKHWGYWVAPRADVRSVQRQEWKLIHYADGMPDELFRLQPGFPFETDNLIAIEPGQGGELLQMLATWFRFGQ